MKPISEMNLEECLDALREMDVMKFDIGYDMDIADRIHELTRWIKVSERMPDEATDGDYCGAVLTREWDGWVTSTHCKLVYPSLHKEWQRIQPTEDK
jgi:hypothetical protein